MKEFSCQRAAFDYAEGLTIFGSRCKLYKENGLWVVERN